MRFTAAVFLVLGILCAGVTSAQVFKHLAHGDSITDGFNDHPLCLGCGAPSCGYPARLASLLGCDGSNCLVSNQGVSGETTAQGITRLNQIFAGDPVWDLLILMHGSNDIFALELPEETVRDNLKRMAYEAAELGIDTLHASIIRFHYLGNWGQFKDPQVDNLGALVQTLAATENRYFSDQRVVLCGALTGFGYQVCQNSLYCEDIPGNPDPWIIGHPRPEGFDHMAPGFANVIQAFPVPGVPSPQTPVGDLCTVSPTFTWTKESPDVANWYQVQLVGPTTFDGWFPEAPVSATSPDPAIPGACSGNACSVTLPGPLLPGNYTWRVRGRNPRGRSAWSADTAFAVFSGPPSAPTGRYPGGPLLDTTPTTPTYVWTQSPQATDYLLDGALPPTSAAGFFCDGVNCSVKPPTPDLNVGSYNWTVTPSNLCGTGLASGIAVFTVVGCSHPGDWPLQQHTVTGSESEDACGTIQAGNLGAGDYVVAGPSGNLTLHAGVAVELHNGFRVETGGALTVRADY